MTAAGTRTLMTVSHCYTTDRPALGPGAGARRMGDLVEGEVELPPELITLGTDTIDYKEYSDTTSEFGTEAPSFVIK
jgi:hypothetical protein